MKRFLSIFILILSLPSSLYAQSIYEAMGIYDHPDKNNSYGFVSLSQSYIANDHPDSLTIPLKAFNKEIPEDYVALNGVYRTRLLEGLNLSESDSLYLYDTQNSLFYQFPISELKAVALKSPYAEWTPLSQDDYYIGFQFKANGIPNTDQLLAYVGENNPFVIGELEPIIWTPIDSICFPTEFESEELQSNDQIFEIKHTYTYNSKHYDYYVQQWATPSWSNRMFHVVVYHRKTNAICFNYIYKDNEFGELRSLSVLDHSKNTPTSASQLTGNLLKDYPPVIFGFNDVMFGCATIHFMELPLNGFELMCDNRH